ncbi:MAG: phenylalanine--tRNA ligase subunit beta, partial [Flavobacteriia bacterium]|nr:phenylalanine--tRNA ligase subunit beta [Flavobacteriia bacterium]
MSHNWLQQFIKVNLPIDEIARLLTDLGLEVEGTYPFQSVKGGLEGVVVGEVLQCEPHPNADRLRITEVDLGEDRKVPIVCGAPNVAKGQKVAVATVGTTLYMHDGTELKIGKSKIRGEVSMGMICAEDELGLGSDHDGILILDNTILTGTPAAEVFSIENDTVFEIGLTPNRADAMSHMGVARDLKALCMLREIPFEWSIPETSSFHVENTNSIVQVEVVDTDRCTQYFGVTLTNVKVAPSPSWLQNRLKAIGISPKNNVVDVTNYVLHELGQPLHAFDASKIDSKIKVQTFPKGTKFTTLDGVERTLSDEDLMISDASTPHCIAGVFGGMDSGVTEQSTTVFLESAYFDPVSIRKTAKLHGLSTDASFRFERGIDPEIGIYALKRASLLIKKIAGGVISSEIQEHAKPLAEPSPLFLSYEQIEKTIGEPLSKKDLNTIVNALEININSVSETGIGLIVPHYRVDVTRPADVIEEILRVYGYNNLSSKPLQFIANPPYSWKDAHKLTEAVADKLTNFGFYEALNNSLTSPEHHSDFHDPVTLVNPLGKELSMMRQSLMHPLLENIAFNSNRQQKQIKLFEFGSVYGQKDTEYIESKRLGIAMVGSTFEAHWDTAQSPQPFFYCKGVLTDIFSGLGLPSLQFESTKHDHFDQAFNLVYRKKSFGVMGLLSKKVVAHFEIDQEVYYAELDWQALLKKSFSEGVTFEEISKYPIMRRDFALLVDEATPFEELQKTALQTEQKILKEVHLFDVYQGKNLPKGKKSYGLSFSFQDNKKTLTDP